MKANTLDPILDTRLKLLEQAVDEVDKITKAMADQRKRLLEVEQRLRSKGMLNVTEGNLEIALSAARSRLNIVLGPEGDEMLPPGLTLEDAERLKEAHGFLTKDAQLALTHFREERIKACESFADVQRWSIAGLADRELGAAARGYRQLLSKIRSSKDAWQRYQQELRGHGEQLFTQYLEVVAGIAVRGLGPKAMHNDDVDALVKLLWPPDAPEPPPSQLYSPLLMGTQHLPLGYPEWNMWTLPLFGRPIAEELISKGTFETIIPVHLQVLCADMYLLHVLGPSYAFAAIFIELQPDDRPAATSPDDPARAQVIIDRLTQLDESEPLQRSLATIANRLAQPWSQARSAVGGGATTLDQADQSVVEDYFSELRTEFKERAYDASRLAEAVTLSEQLVADREALSRARPEPRDLLTAIWLARLDNPDKARDIHEAASSLRPRWHLGGGPLNWQRPPRLGV